MCINRGRNETGIQNDSVTGLNYTTAKVQGEGMIYNTMRIPGGDFTSWRCLTGVRFG